MDAPIPDWLRERLVTSRDGTVEVKHTPTKCDDCDKQIDKLRVVTCKKNWSYGEWWGIYCNGCGCYKHPVTGRFEVGKKKVGPVFKQYNKTKDK